MELHCLRITEIKPLKLFGDDYCGVTIGGEIHVVRIVYRDVFANGDGEITWHELKARHAAIDAYALGRLRIASAGETCPLTVSDHLVDSHTDGAYAVLRFIGTCPQSGPTLTMNYLTRGRFVEQ